MERLSTEKCKELEYITAITKAKAKYMKGLFLTTKSKDGESKFTKMETFMLVNLWEVEKMGMGDIFGFIKTFKSINRKESIFNGI